jgi:uncharacterized SAM-binding protein YcdF (DUF218 family)
MINQNTGKDAGKHTSSNNPLISFFLIVCLVIIVVIGVDIVFTGMGRILIVSDSLEKSDAVVVLSGGEGRLEEAARLYQEKMAEKMILTETGEFSQEYGKISEIKRFDAMLNLGIPAGAIMVTEKTVGNTIDEAHVVRKIIQPMNFNSLIVVTDPSHSLRTRLVFRQEFSDTDIKVAVHPVPGHWYRAATWWMSKAGWEATLGEYLRLAYYFLRYNP